HHHDGASERRDRGESLVELPGPLQVRGGRRAGERLIPGDPGLAEAIEVLRVGTPGLLAGDVLHAGVSPAAGIRQDDDRDAVDLPLALEGLAHRETRGWGRALRAVQLEQYKVSRRVPREGRPIEHGRLEQAAPGAPVRSGEIDEQILA